MKIIGLTLLGLANVAFAFLERSKIPHKTYYPVNGTDRPDIYQTSTENFKLYADTLRKFMWRDSGKDYEELIKSTHLAWYTAWHDPANNSPYLFINKLELELQKIEPQVKIPSWNYTKYIGSCVTDPVFADEFFGSKVSIKMCLTDGNFIPPHEFNRGCLKRRSLSRGFDHTNLKSESEILSETGYGLWRELMRNTNILSGHLWGYGHKNYDPLIFSMQAYHLKLLSKWGKDNNYNVDIDFNRSSLGNITIFESNTKAEYGN